MCQVALKSMKYLWRHNAILNYILGMIDKKSFVVYSDLPGFTTPAGGSIPADLLVTPLKPDIVIIDQKNKTVEIAELTCPFDGLPKRWNIFHDQNDFHFIWQRFGLTFFNSFLVGNEITECNRMPVSLSS